MIFIAISQTTALNFYTSLHGNNQEESVFCQKENACEHLQKLPCIMKSIYDDVVIFDPLTAFIH